MPQSRAWSQPITRSQFLRGTVALGAAGALAACSGGSGSGATASGGSTGSISFFGWDVADTTTGLGLGFATAKTAWETANKGSSVKFDGVPFDQFVTAATTRARAGKLGDVVEMLPDVTHAAVFPALSKLKKSDFGSLGDDLTGWDAALMVDSKDTWAGVPIGAQGTLWYYNKALFTKAGLDPEKPPATWDEFSAACAALQKSGVTPLGFSGVDSNLAWWAWSGLTAQFFPTFDDVLAVRSGDVDLTDPKFAQSLAPLEETFKAGWWNADYSAKRFADIEAAFAAGQIGIVPGLITSAMNWSVWDAKLGKDAYGVFTSPLVEGGSQQKQFFNPTLIYGISAKSQRPEVAKSWISYLASAEGQTTLLKESGQFPNRADVDVNAVTQSAGAKSIGDIVAKVGGIDVVQNQFNAAATGAALKNLTVALTSGGVSSFLSDLQQQQGS